MLEYAVENVQCALYQQDTIYLKKSVKKIFNEQNEQQTVETYAL